MMNKVSIKSIKKSRFKRTKVNQAMFNIKNIDLNKLKEEINLSKLKMITNKPKIFKPIKSNSLKINLI